MAHSINQVNGVGSIFSTKPMWHGQGTVVDGALTSGEALQAANLDFDVDKTALQTVDGLDVSGKFATVRRDTNEVLGVVGADYKVVQNRDSFKFFDAIVGDDEAMFETAGALGKGEKIFITAKLPAYMSVGDDLIEQYLFLYNSHDGSSAITCAFTPVRIVCNNTLTAAFGRMSNKVSIRHTTNVVYNLEQAHKLMGVVNNLTVEMEKVFNKMRDTYVSDDKVRELVELALAPTDAFVDQEGFSSRFVNMVDSVYAYTMEDSTQVDIRNSLWGIYNGVTGYYTNEKTYKTENDRINSMFFGDYNKKAQRTMTILSEMI